MKTVKNIFISRYFSISLIALFSSTLCNIQLSAQVNIEGQVSDIDNSPIPFANIYLKKHKEGVKSDQNGNFTLQIKDNSYTKDSLSISFFGYRTIVIAIDLTKNSKHKIILHKSLILLDEFSLEAKKKKVLTALQIVKKTISNVSKNNINTSYTTEGFYRELIRENDKAIKVNEAAIRFNFSPYPQKRGYKSGFNKYWDIYYDYYRSLHKTSGFPMLSQHYGYFNTKNDAAKVLGSRFSNQQGDFNSSVNPSGGPLDLTGNDKLKFQYDFFHNKRFSDYSYIKEGIIEDQGEWCYLIRFRPKKPIKGYLHHNWSKKMEYAVYSGEMLISVNDFTVHQVICEHEFLNKPSNLRNNKYQFISSQLQLNYGSTDNGWMLTNVLNKQIIIVKNNGQKDKFEIIRTLNISDSIINQKEEQYPWTERLDLARGSTVEDFTQSYDEQFWEEYEFNPLFSPLSQEDLNSLEYEKSLYQQYSSQFTPIDLITVPKPNKIANYLNLHTDSLADNYRWLENKSDETLKYIKEENNYYNRVIRQVKKYRNEYMSMYNAVLIRDTVAPSIEKFNGYQLIRKSIDDSLRLFHVLEDSSQRELFNYQKLEKPNIHKVLSVSSHLSFLAHAFNTDYGFTYTMVVENLSNKNLPDTIYSVSNFQWLNDSILVYNTSNLPARYPANAVYWYNARTKKDSLLFKGYDDPFRAEIKQSQSKDIVFILTKTKNEVSTVFLNQNLEIKKTKGPSSLDISQIKHFYGSYIYCVRNYNQLYATSINDQKKSMEKLIFSGKEKQTIRDFKETKNHIILTLFEGGTVKLIIIDKDDEKQTSIEFEESLCSVHIDEIDYNADTCIIAYESPISPYSYYHLNLKTKEKKVNKSEGKLGTLFNPKYFEIKQVFAKTEDKKKIAITYLNRKYIKESKGTILRVYGSYAAMHSPAFSKKDLALAQLGFTMAYAHVRGNIYNGETWYTDGSLHNKQNGINDYIECARYLIDNGIATDSTLIGIGTSAGGLIVGAAINQAPELFNTVILDRPFLDVLTSQSNDSLPTVLDGYPEVGNPYILKDYRSMSAYCPYQNIEPMDYPNILYLGGLRDWNVEYWAPLKHLVAIRENNQSNTKQIIQLSETEHYIPYSKGITDDADIYGFLMYNLTKVK